MKMIFAAAAIALAIATPALAQSAQPQQGGQQSYGGTYQGYPVGEWYRPDNW
jgi:opacity protein-like surface antigen